MSDDFRSVIERQLRELRTARTADEVLSILSRETALTLIGDGVAGDGFFAGSGGDGSVDESLTQAGWHHIWFEAWYHCAMQAPNGDMITYVEGDIYRGNTRSRSS
ncbi:hypothetical protein Kisp01_70360 [Kineosporia sp. NBRC 101677]|uniref:hypothetical protein n=1 Tax=Kineosporia sp. NBRC 101677 TaxID=3032197 RepID=UPI0024A2B429|nr:hypothetical protein [Kineosporia sp. NBRC 101677]GLY20022.1 hypothetical protein Kisp01_70360 [Kineosporia sp. NBRC 101677]